MLPPMSSSRMPSATNQLGVVFPTSNPYTVSGNFGDGTLEPTVTAALRILHELPSEFNVEFFSKKNVSFIQNKLISETKKFTGFTIGPQGESDLIQIMAGIYVQYSTFSGDLKSSMKKVNTITIAECLKQILPGVQSYARYVRDASLPFGGGGLTAFRRPELSTTKGSNTLTGFLPLSR